LRTVIVEDSSERLTLSLPAPRRYLTMVLLALGLAFWTYLFIASVGAMFTQLSGSIAALFFILLWFLGWLLAGAVALYALLWMTLGREIVTLAGDTLTLRRDLKGHGTNQTYKARHIENLRVTPDPFSFYEFATSLRPFGLGGGKLIFDYLTLVGQFGAGISLDEAQVVCDRLRQRLAKTTAAAIRDQ
jgi:hypothetical protein